MDFDFSALTINEARQRLTHSDSLSRLPELLGIQYRMAEDDFLRLLGEEWSGFDNIGNHIDDLSDSPLFLIRGQEGVVKCEMMTPEEFAVFEALPDVITVYRGCYKPNKWGLSWSLSKTVAEQFPTLNRYRQDGQPLLVTAQAMKKNIIAVKLDRKESEIITWRPRHISTRHIKVCP